MSTEVTPEGRDLLQTAQAMLRNGEIEKAGAALGNLRDPVLVRDWRINRVREVIHGQPTPTALAEAEDLLSQVLQDTR